MSTFTPNKTNSIVVLPHSSGVHPITIVGSGIDCTTKRGAVVFLYHAYIESTADTNPGSFKVQVRPEGGTSLINQNWSTVFTGTAMGTTPDSEALTGTENAGDDTLNVANTTGFAVDDVLYIQHPTLSSGEWAELKTLVTNTNIQLIDGLTNNHTSSSMIWNDARRWVVPLDLNGIESFRVVWSHQGATGANGHVKALAITYDSDNST